MSRPFIFSQEIAKQVIEKLRDGETQEQAARAVGVTRSTLLRWLREGRKGVPKFAEFAREYRDTVMPQQQEHADDAPSSTPGPFASYKRRPTERREVNEGAGYPNPADHAASDDPMESRERMLNQCHSMRDELGMLRRDIDAQYQAARIHRDYVNYEIDRLRNSIDALVDAARTEIDANDRVKQEGRSYDGTEHEESHS